MIDLAVCPDFAMVAVHNPGGGSQADAGAFEVLVAMEAMEGRKEAVGISHIESGAVVTDEIGSLRSVPPKLDEGFGAARGKFDGVTEKVFERNPDETGITCSREARLDAELDGAIGILLDEISCDRLGDSGEIEVGRFKLRSSNARELQKSIDKLAHTLDAGADAMDEILPRLVDRCGVILFEGEAEAVDSA